MPRANVPVTVSVKPLRLHSMHFTRAFPFIHWCRCKLLSSMWVSLASFILKLSMWVSLELGLKFGISVRLRECSIDSPWYPSENARYTPVAPFPRPAFEIYTFGFACCWSWHWFSCWYAYDNSTGNLDHTRKASMWVSGRTYCSALLLCNFRQPATVLDQKKRQF